MSQRKKTNQNIMSESYISKVKTVFNVITPIIAIFGLGLSIYNTYQNTKPANINVSIGDKITFSINNNIFQIALPVIAYNEGSQFGVLYDLEIELRNLKDNTSYCLYYVRDLEIKDPMNAVFVPSNTDSPIMLSGKESEYRFIDFSTEKEGDIPASGEYELIIKGNDKPREDKVVLTSFELDFGKENYDFLLEKGFATMYPYTRK